MALTAWLLPLLALALVLAIAVLRGRYAAEHGLSRLRRAFRAARRRPVDSIVSSARALGRVLAPRRAARLAGLAVRPPPAALAPTR